MLLLLLQLADVLPDRLGSLLLRTVPDSSAARQSHIFEMFPVLMIPYGVTSLKKYSADIITRNTCKYK